LNSYGFLDIWFCDAGQKTVINNCNTYIIKDYFEEIKYILSAKTFLILTSISNIL